MRYEYTYDTYGNIRSVEEYNANTGARISGDAYSYTNSTWLDNERDAGKVIASSVAGGFGALFSGSGALKDINQYNYIKSQKNIYKKAILNGKSKEMAKSYYKKMTTTIYKMASAQAVKKVAISSGVAIMTSHALD